MREVVLVTGRTLVPPETLKKVMEAGPQGLPKSTVVARDILHLLSINSIKANQEFDMEGNPYFYMYIRDLAAQFEQSHAADGKVTPKWMSMALSSLGIRNRHRRNDGSLVMWTQKQLDILKSYFQLGQRQ